MSTESTAVINIYQAIRTANNRLEAHYYDELADRFWEEAGEFVRLGDVQRAVELLTQAGHCIRTAHQLDRGGTMTTRSL